MSGASRELLSALLLDLLALCRGDVTLVLIEGEGRWDRSKQITPASLCIIFSSYSIGDSDGIARAQLNVWVVEAVVGMQAFTETDYTHI